MCLRTLRGSKQDCRRMSVIRRNEERRGVIRMIKIDSYWDERGLQGVMRRM